jgi:alkanesulfonate monooxygenase SsuD/methylene tetrahydromethanopterin reductase-like flavin-dependent oxidoreductase (luciferase family)
MSKEGKWKEMAGLIDDDVVRTFAAVGDVPTVARELRERWSAATRLTFYMPYRADDDVRRQLLAELR